MGQVARLEWVTSLPLQNLTFFSLPENAHRVKSNATASKEVFLDLSLAHIAFQPLAHSWTLMVSELRECEAL